MTAQRSIRNGDPLHAGLQHRIIAVNAVVGVINTPGYWCSTHEFCDVVAGNLWGKPERWIDEGLATYADGRGRSGSHAAARDLSAQGRLLPTSRSGGLRRSGRLVRFLHEKVGTEKLKKIWQTGHARIAKITGQSMEWHNAFEPPQSAGAMP